MTLYIVYFRFLSGQFCTRPIVRPYDSIGRHVVGQQWGTGWATFRGFNSRNLKIYGIILCSDYKLCAPKRAWPKEGEGRFHRLRPPGAIHRLPLLAEPINPATAVLNTRPVIIIMYHHVKIPQISAVEVFNRGHEVQSNSTPLHIT